MRTLFYILLSITCWTLCQTDTFAQITVSKEEGKGIVLTYASPAGNYLRVLPRGDRDEFDKTMKSTSFFKVYRGKVVLGNDELKEIGKITRVKKAKELQNAIGKELDAEFRKFSSFTTDEQVDQFLANEYHSDTLEQYTMIDIRFLAPFGMGFLDKQVKQDSIYYYHVVRVDKSGTEEIWGSAQVGTKVANPELKKLNVDFESASTSDSVISIRWKVQFPVFTAKQEYPLLTDLDDKLPLNEYIKEYASQNRILANFYNSKELNSSNTKFNIFYKKNDELEWHLASRAMAYTDSAANYYVSTTLRALPEDLISTVVVPEDYAMALGDTSKTTALYAIAQSTVPFIYAVRGVDSTNCIKISWDKLPNKPYYTGITISRSYDDNQQEVVAQLDYQASSYTDFEVIPGKNYMYYVSPRFLPQQPIKQEIPANVVASCTKFARPLPPYNLTVDTASKEYPKLAWEAAADKANYAFFVYRGLSPDKLLLVSPPVKSNEYTDTTSTLSGRSTYYYAVMQQNLAQDTSDFSNQVSFSPIKIDDMWRPTYIKHTIVNNDLILEWDDARKNDDFVLGYVLQRKRQENGTYESIGEILTSNSWIDTTYKKGETYYYRVAAVSLKGDTTAYTDAFAINYGKATISNIKNLDLINHPKGIQLKWPSIEADDIVAYKVYRRSGDEDDYTLLAKIEKGNFDYLDGTTVSGQSYVYSVVVVDKDGRESPKTTISSIARSIPVSVK